MVTFKGTVIGIGSRRRLSSFAVCQIYIFFNSPKKTLRLYVIKKGVRDQEQLFVKYAKT